MARTVEVTFCALSLLAASCAGSGAEDSLSGAGQGASAGASGRSGGTAGTSTGGSGGSAGSGGITSSGGHTGGGSAGSAGGGRAGGASGGSSGNGAAGRGGGGGMLSTGGAAGGANQADGGDATAGADGEAGAPNPGGLTAFRLAVIGSSTAAGEGASSSAKGWVSLLAGSLRMTVTTSFTSVNLAQGGYTTSELLPDSGDNGSIDDALEQAPNLVLVSLAGSNDLSAGTSTSTFLSRLRAIRDRAVDAGVPIFFVSTAPKDLSTSEREALRDWASEMETAFSSCWAPGRTAQYSPCFIDIFGVLANDSLGVESDYSAGDGIHLNDAGHAVIFEAAAPIVEAYVCSMTDCG